MKHPSLPQVAGPAVLRHRQRPPNVDHTLTENRQPSTFPHETGHFYLEMMGDLAWKTRPPDQQVKDDMPALLGLAGVKSRADCCRTP